MHLGKDPEAELFLSHTRQGCNEAVQLPGPRSTCKSGCEGGWGAEELKTQLKITGVFSWSPLALSGEMILGVPFQTLKFLKAPTSQTPM